MSFDGIVGQDAAIGLLRESILKDRVASGYLFSGPDGVGKRTTALRFARAILCSVDGAEACGECPSCIRAKAGSHPGLIEVARGEKKSEIVLAQIHDLASRLALRPMEGDCTVAVIDEAERANIESLNALLKTLEEPPPGASIILVTKNREALPETIRSRCQGVRFRPLARDAVLAILAKDGRVEPDLVPGLVDLAGGSPGRAIRLAELGYPAIGQAVSELLRDEDGAGPVAVAEGIVAAFGEGALADRRDRAREVVLLLIEEVRSRYLSPDLPERDPDRATRAIRPLTEALERLDLNVSPETVLKAALVHLMPELAPDPLGNCPSDPK